MRKEKHIETGQLNTGTIRNKCRTKISYITKQRIFVPIRMMNETGVVWPIVLQSVQVVPPPM